jgi:hypothetical protein
MASNVDPQRRIRLALGRFAPVLIRLGHGLHGAHAPPPVGLESRHALGSLKDESIGSHALDQKLKQQFVESCAVHVIVMCIHGEHGVNAHSFMEVASNNVCVVSRCTQIPVVRSAVQHTSLWLRLPTVTNSRHLIAVVVNQANGQAGLNALRNAMERRLGHGRFQSR